jgi:hypothetical protein
MRCRNSAVVPVVRIEPEVSESRKTGIIMGVYRLRFLEAVTANTRIDALCDFIEFWLALAIRLSGRPQKH